MSQLGAASGVWWVEECPAVHRTAYSKVPGPHNSGATVEKPCSHGIQLLRDEVHSPHGVPWGSIILALASDFIPHHASFSLCSSWSGCLSSAHRGRHTYYLGIGIAAPCAWNAFLSRCPAAHFLTSFSFCLP